MTQSAGYRGRKISASAMSKDDELYGSYVRESQGEPFRNGMVSRDTDSQQSTDTRLRNTSRQPVDRLNR